MPRRQDEKEQPKRTNWPRRSLCAGITFGVGVAAFIDETVFHQLLHWRHFYDGSTLSLGLLSDGLVHAFSWVATVLGLVLAADAARRGALARRLAAGGVLLGAGAFQLYDGLVHHRLMRLHQIRYEVDLVAYGWTWNLVAVLLLAVSGWLLLPALRRRPGEA